jgi:hypothetical protein
MHLAAVTPGGDVNNINAGREEIHLLSLIL